MGSRSPSVALFLLGAALCVVSCRGDGDRSAQPAEPPGRAPERPSAAASLDPPAAAGALAPNLAVVAGELAASWLEPVALPEAGEAARPGHRLRFSRLHAGGWTEPVTVARGTNFFANWADVPAVVEAGDGTLYAHWLAKTAAGTYAYSIFLARSRDGGESWEPIGKLNSDSTPTEHGFVSFVVESDGARAIWLDGRGMVDGGPMTLRTAAIRETGAGTKIGPEEVLDERVCECCSTGATLAAGEPVAVYRDRGASEVRDIGFVRRDAGGWSDPAKVADDGWQIAGCPVNGPEIDAEESRVAVAWFTSAGGAARVQVAFSDDSARTFAAPLVVDEGEVLGRSDVVVDPAGAAWVSWMARVDEGAEIRVRRVSPDGVVEPWRVVAASSAARAAGFPKLRRVADSLYVAWVDVGAEGAASRIRLRAL